MKHKIKRKRKNFNPFVNITLRKKYKSFAKKRHQRRKIKSSGPVINEIVPSATLLILGAIGYGSLFNNGSVATLPVSVTTTTTTGTTTTTTGTTTTTTPPYTVNPTIDVAPRFNVNLNTQLEVIGAGFTPNGQVQVNQYVTLSDGSTSRATGFTVIAGSTGAFLQDNVSVSANPSTVGIFYNATDLKTGINSTNVVVALATTTVTTNGQQAATQPTMPIVQTTTTINPAGLNTQQVAQAQAHTPPAAQNLLAYLQTLGYGGSTQGFTSGINIYFGDGVVYDATANIAYEAQSNFPGQIAGHTYYSIEGLTQNQAVTVANAINIGKLPVT